MGTETIRWRARPVVGTRRARHAFTCARGASASSSPEKVIAGRSGEKEATTRANLTACAAIQFSGKVLALAPKVADA